MIKLLFFLVTIFPMSLSLQTSAADDLPSQYVFLGDSMTWLGGDDCDQPKGWTKWFADGLAVGECKSYARSGATLSNTPATKENLKENVGIISDYNTVYNQIRRMQEAIAAGTQPMPDVILVGAGANDAWFLKKRPGALKMTAVEAMLLDSARLVASPAHALTIASATRQAILMLHHIAPQATIIFLAPNQSVSVPAGNLTKAADIIAEVCNEMEIDVIRQDLYGPISAEAEKRKKNLTYDGTHTSEAGGKALGEFLLKSVSEKLGKNILR